MPKVEVKKPTDCVLVRLFIDQANSDLMKEGMAPEERSRLLNLDPRSGDLYRALYAIGPQNAMMVYKVAMQLGGEPVEPPGFS